MSNQKNNNLKNFIKQNFKIFVLGDQNVGKTGMNRSMFYNAIISILLCNVYNLTAFIVRFLTKILIVKCATGNGKK